jgi:hypothetical protein
LGWQSYREWGVAAAAAAAAAAQTAAIGGKRPVGFKTLLLHMHACCARME